MSRFARNTIRLPKQQQTRIIVLYDSDDLLGLKDDILLMLRNDQNVTRESVEDIINKSFAVYGL